MACLSVLCRYRLDLFLRFLTSPLSLSLHPKKLWPGANAENDMAVSKLLVRYFPALRFLSPEINKSCDFIVFVVHLLSALVFFCLRDRILRIDRFPRTLQIRPMQQSSQPTKPDRPSLLPD